ncbi:HesA/MoeB/ThiF family protein [Sulfurovum sp. NBC37-1]|uniref:HesA/MoeB/ThiF family protein n=1 Tax=Sulfurovum sp. (strain NBC37-1) TaxID=387093 RepID=UPI0001587A54|nr:HesA/MoeB/ThiF family protein [Sulfurovum sp. NBC37-1]BAF72734.1 ThiF/MoeB/HesA family protein [Sulfurovum sp. NBC37-1]
MPTIENIPTPEEYFNRQIQLWGENTQKSLQAKKIAIIGSGGLGSTLAMALGTSGIGEIHMVDFDTVSIHNIHRQIAFTLSDEGKNKARAIVKLIESKNPFVKAVAFDMPFDDFKEMGNRYDLILDATDNLPVRGEIDKHAKASNTPWIYASVEEFNGQVCFFDEADFQVFNISDHKPGGIAAPIVMHIGSLQANLALRYLAGLPVVKDKLYYLYFNEEGELVTQKFGMPKA